MIIVHTCLTTNSMQYEHLRFIEENADTVKTAIRRGSTSRVDLDNGEIHYFIPVNAFPRWREGQIYWLNGVLYHGEYPVKGAAE